MKIMKVEQFTKQLTSQFGKNTKQKLSDLEKENANLRTQIKLFERKESKLKIHSRKEFQRKIKSIFREPKQSRMKAAILSMDIDNMGQLNTEYGYNVANAVMNIVEREIINECNQYNDNYTTKMENDNNIDNPLHPKFVQCIPYKPFDQGIFFLY